MSHNESFSQAMTKGQYVLYGSLLFLALMILAIVKFRSRAVSSEVSPASFQVPVLKPSYDWSKQNATAVVAIRDGCHFCEDSAPFYRRLVSQAQQGKIGARIIFVMPDTQSIGKSDLPENATESQGYYDVPLKSFGIRGTPTILLISNSRQVIRVWQGELTPREEDRVVSLLK